MKRAIGLLLLALGFPLLTAIPSVAAPDGSGPGCAQLVAGFPNYTDDFEPEPDSGSAKMFVAPVTLESASCPYVTYTATAYTPGGAVLGSQSQRGDGTNPLIFEVAVPVAQSPICGTVTSSVGKAKVFDRIPSSSHSDCAVGGLLLLDGGIGAGKWQ